MELEPEPQKICRVERGGSRMVSRTEVGGHRGLVGRPTILVPAPLGSGVIMSEVQARVDSRPIRDRNLCFMRNRKVRLEWPSVFHGGAFRYRYAFLYRWCRHAYPVLELCGRCLFEEPAGIRRKQFLISRQTSRLETELVLDGLDRLGSDNSLLCLKIGSMYFSIACLPELVRLGPNEI